MLLIVFILSFCDNRNPINFTDNNLPNNNTVTDVASNNEFDSWNFMQEIVEGFVLCFKDASFKTILYTSISNSIYPENKVDFKKFLYYKNNIGKSVIDAIAENSNLTNDEIENIVNSIPLEIDMYFPVDEHRDTWQNYYGTLLIALPLLDNKGDINKIIGFNSEGKRLLLNKAEKPNIPTLVIYPSETRGKTELVTVNNVKNKFDEHETTEAVMLMNIVVDGFILSTINYDQPSWLLGDM